MYQIRNANFLDGIGETPINFRDQRDPNQTEAPVHLASWRNCFCCIFLLIVLGCKAPRDEQSLTVFAAASTTDFLTQLGSTFEMETDYQVHLSFAGSSTLSRQIAAGATPDIFISANPEWTQFLKNKFPNLPQIKPYLRNQIVLIAAPGHVLPESLAAWQVASSRVAMGNPDHVPAGKYAKAALQSADLWPAVHPQVVPTASVREALRLVLAGECEWGLVYRSDATAGALQSLPLIMPKGDVIQYQVLQTNPRFNPAGEAFMSFLFSSYAEALAIRMDFQWPQSLE